MQWLNAIVEACCHESSPPASASPVIMFIRQ